jgi:uncharacterized protein
MADTKYTPGRFVWRELLTPDVAKSRAFYGALFGWTFADVPMPGAGEGATYTLAHCGERQHGGLFDLKHVPMPGVPAHWELYVSVPNVDEAASAAPANGGKVYVPPTDIPNIGRFAGIFDGQGAATTAFKSAQGDPEPYERPPVGAFCWEQLNTSDPAAAKAFYAKLYGWTCEPFAGGGDIETFKAGDAAVASVMKAPDGVPSHWLTYVVVEALGAARAKVESLGGKVLMPEIDVPTVGKIAVVADDVGAFIGLFEPSA